MRTSPPLCGLPFHKIWTSRSGPGTPRSGRPGGFGEPLGAVAASDSRCLGGCRKRDEGSSFLPFAGRAMTLCHSGLEVIDSASPLRAGCDSRSLRNFTPRSLAVSSVASHGRDNTPALARCFAWLPGLPATVEEYIRSCPTCDSVKANHLQHACLLYPLPVPMRSSGSCIRLD